MGSHRGRHPDAEHAMDQRGKGAGKPEPGKTRHSAGGRQSAPFKNQKSHPAGRVLQPKGRLPPVHGEVRGRKVRRRVGKNVRPARATASQRAASPQGHRAGNRGLHPALFRRKGEVRHRRVHAKDRAPNRLVGNPFLRSNSILFRGKPPQRRQTFPRVPRLAGRIGENELLQEKARLRKLPVDGRLHEKGR